MASDEGEGDSDPEQIIKRTRSMARRCCWPVITLRRTASAKAEFRYQTAATLGFEADAFVKHANADQSQKYPQGRLLRKAQKLKPRDNVQRTEKVELVARMSGPEPRIFSHGKGNNGANGRRQSRASVWPVTLGGALLRRGWFVRLVPSPRPSL